MLTRIRGQEADAYVTGKQVTEDWSFGMGKGNQIWVDILKG